MATGKQMPHITRVDAWEQSELANQALRTYDRTTPEHWYAKGVLAALSWFQSNDLAEKPMREEVMQRNRNNHDR